MLRGAHFRSDWQRYGAAAVVTPHTFVLSLLPKMAALAGAQAATFGEKRVASPGRGLASPGA
jgi:hypothetical protein